jgi:hypothetical protein
MKISCVVEARIQANANRTMSFSTDASDDTEILFLDGILNPKIRIVKVGSPQFPRNKSSRSIRSGFGFTPQQAANSAFDHLFNVYTIGFA